MQESDLHDLSDDSDYAASKQNQGLRVISRTTSGQTIAEDEADGSQVVFWRDNVTIHPTQYAFERISGRLQLIKHASSLLMTWIPYKEKPMATGPNSNARLSKRDKNLYTIRGVPVTDIRSIRRHVPTFGWQYLIIVLSSGLAFPPLYFYNGGVREFLATLKQYTFLARSADDVNVLLVNDFQDPLQRSLSSLELPRVVPITNSSSTPNLASSVSLHKNSESIEDESSGISQYGDRDGLKRRDSSRDLSIQVLEKFSLVTKFARETTTHLFREIQNDGILAYEGKKRSQSPPKIDRKTEPDEVQSVPEEISVTVDPLKLDKLTLEWGQPRQAPLGSEEWATFLDAEGRVMDSQALRKRIFYGGLEHQIRNEVWKFLLGYHEFGSTSAEREYLASVKKVEYEILKCQWQSISPAQTRKFSKFRERKGLIEKDVVRTDRSTSFYDGDDNPNVALLRDILLTYSFYDFDLGYCQGMSDLLSPILYVMSDETDTFWCFAALMERLRPNFNRDQNGMHSQLFALAKLVELLDCPLHNYFRQRDCLNFFFCFRWVLVQFKREFVYEKIMCLWEVFWTHLLSEHFHLYVCVAILKKHRSKIMGEKMSFDTLLKFINELSGHIDLDETLRNAEALCVHAGENGAACIPPGTPSSLPVDANFSDILQDRDDTDT